MSRTYRKIDREIVNSFESAKGFKRETNKKFRRVSKQLINNDNFDILPIKGNEVTDIWGSNVDHQKTTGFENL